VQQKLLPAVQQLGVPACRTTPRVSQHSSGPPLPYRPRSIFPQSQRIACHQEEIRSRFGHSPHLSQSLKSSAWTLKMFTRALAAVVFEGCTGSSKATGVCQNAIKWRTWLTQTRHRQHSIRWTDVTAVGKTMQSVRGLFQKAGGIPVGLKEV
jgi:hypothetical protein